METLEVHTLICSRDVGLWLDTLKLFRYYYGGRFDVVIHEDGSFTEDDVSRLQIAIPYVRIIRRYEADYVMRDVLKNHPNCSYFRFAEHHTIFRIKLFDPFLMSASKNVLNMDADILFCKTPSDLIKNMENTVGCYMRDTWSSYCVPFRDEDNDILVDRFINAGLTYVPSASWYSLDSIEECLGILYDHGSKGATHPFLEQNCLAYMISDMRRRGVPWLQLPHPDYCIPVFNEFKPNHGLTALHLNSSQLVGKYRAEHYIEELNKI